MDWADSDAVKLSAVKDVLDRAGYKVTDRVDVTSAGERLTSFAIQSRQDAENR